MSGFSKKLKIRIVTMVIIAMCVMNCSPMTAYASEPDAFEKATMVVDGVNREAIRYNGEGPFVLELVVDGFTGELANTRFNVFFDESFGTATVTGAAISSQSSLEVLPRSGYYKIENAGSEKAGLFEVQLKEGETGLTMAFVPSDSNSLISVDWYSSGKDKLTVTIRPMNAISKEYEAIIKEIDDEGNLLRTAKALEDFKLASMEEGLGTAGKYAAFTNFFNVFGDYEGNIATHRARLGGNGQFGVTQQGKEYTNTYIEELEGNWNGAELVKKTTDSLVLGTYIGENGEEKNINIAKDNGANWILWNENIAKKISAKDNLAYVFSIADLQENAKEKVINFNDAFVALRDLADKLSGKKILELTYSFEDGYKVIGKGDKDLDPSSVSDIKVKSAGGDVVEITIVCKAGRNIVSFPAELLKNGSKSWINFEGENGTEDYSVIINLTGLDSESVELDSHISLEGNEQQGNTHSISAGKLLWNFGTYDGEVKLMKTDVGVVLAPCAKVSVWNQTHNGSIIANEVEVRSGEIHKNSFQWKEEPTPEVTPEPSETVTPSPEETPDPTTTPKPTGTPTPSPAAQVSVTPEPSETVTPSPEPSVTPPGEDTPTPDPKPSETPSVTPPGEDTPTPDPKPSETPSVTPPGEDTPTPEPSETPSVTPPGEDTPTPEPSETPSVTPSGEDTPTPEPSETPGVTPPGENTLTPTLEPSETPSVTPPGEDTPTPTPEPSETPSVTPPGENTPTPTPEPSETPSVTPPGENTPTPTPEPSETPGVTPPGENTPTPTPEPSETPGVTPPGENTPTPTDSPTPTPGDVSTPTPIPTPYNTIPTNTPIPTPTNTPTPTPTPDTTPTPVPTLPYREVEPSVSPTPSDSATSTPEATVTPEPSDDGTPTPPEPIPTPEEEYVDIPDEPEPLGTPDDPSKPDEEITVFDPEELLDILDDIPLGIPEAEPEKDPEEIEIEDDTPEGLPQTGVAGTGLFVAIGMAMMSFGAVLGLGGRKKKDKENEGK